MIRCPDCGCNDVEDLGPLLLLGRTARRFGCRWCGRRFVKRYEQNGQLSAENEEPSFATRPRCPHCGGRGKVLSTRRAVRYCRCGVCGQPFKQSAI